MLAMPGCLRLTQWAVVDLPPSRAQNVARLLLPSLRHSDGSLTPDIRLLCWKEFRPLFSSLEADIPWGNIELYLLPFRPQQAVLQLQSEALADGSLSAEQTPVLHRLATGHQLLYVTGAPSQQTAIKRLAALVAAFFSQKQSPAATQLGLQSLFRISRELTQFPGLSSQPHELETVVGLLCGGGDRRLGESQVQTVQVAWQQARAETGEAISAGDV